MAVGAGSIKRAAKANMEVSGKVEQIPKDADFAEKAVRTVSDTRVAQAVQQEDSLKELVQEKQVGDKKTPTKKTTKKGTSSDKKKDTILNKKESVMEENTQMNQVCHITEDLPVYLL